MAAPTLRQQRLWKLLSLVPLVFGTLESPSMPWCSVPLGVAESILPPTSCRRAAQIRQTDGGDHGGAADRHPRLPGGLWFAPIIEGPAGVILLLILPPMGMLLTALVWNYLPGARPHLAAEGWHAILYPCVAVHRLGRLRPEPHHRERLHAR